MRPTTDAEQRELDRRRAESRRIIDSMALLCPPRPDRLADLVSTLTRARASCVDATSRLEGAAPDVVARHDAPAPIRSLFATPIARLDAAVAGIDNLLSLLATIRTSQEPSP